MDAISFPEDLTTLDDDALDKLRKDVESRGEELTDAEASDDNVTELEQLAERLDTVEAEQDTRKAAAEERAGRQETAAAKFKKDDPAAVEDEINEQVETETEVTDSEEDKVAEVVAIDAAAEEAPAVQDTTPIPDAVAASTTGDKIAEMSARRAGTTIPRTGEGDSGAFMEATSHSPDREGTEYGSVEAVATAITNRRLGWTSSPTGTRDFVPIAHGRKQFSGEMLSDDPVANYAKLRDVQVGAAHELGEALVASGGACAEYAPSYEFFRLAEPQNPVEQGTPVVQAPRGGINYIVPPNVSQAAGAIDISAQDRDFGAGFVQFVSGPKACIAVTCPPTQSAEVSAVSQCVLFDNLNYRVFPEQVAAFMEDVAVQFTAVKEVFYLDYMNTQSTAVTGDYGYGFSRSILHDWTLATTAYRKRHYMGRTTDMVVAAPDWAMDAIKLDMALDGQQGLNFWDISDGQVMAALSARNISPIWYNDNPTGVTPNQKFNAAQAAGALNPWPNAVVSYIYAPGTFVRLDGGTLDVGLVRDSTLNRTNDLQLFMEEWIGMAQLGFESVRLTSTLCVNGAGPAGVTAVTC